MSASSSVSSSSPRGSCSIDSLWWADADDDEGGSTDGTPTLAERGFLLRSAIELVRKMEELRRGSAIAKVFIGCALEGGNGETERERGGKGKCSSRKWNFNANSG
jgi:hypothetical protein